ncbi:MAG: DUF354 domain-containing protein [candidate division KSB1 bacterium]|nr:DUF354 domain-containing protein [candidate division KSB1 bacterium]
MPSEKPIIWFDITNVPHVNFLKPLYKLLKDRHDILFTVRDFAESIGLFKSQIAEPFIKVGEHKGQNRIRKVFGVFERTYQLFNFVREFDIKISVGGDSSSLYAKLRRKPSITFDDNEKAPNWRYSHFSDFAFWPEAIPIEDILRQGFRRHKLYQYHGYKEDIYVADYIPDPSFLKQLPFDNYVVVRPENIQANYVNGNRSLVPNLLQGLANSGINILFLPRYKHDIDYASGFKNVCLPDKALNGLDVCYYSDAVLTGAGTLAREAACLGVPSFSFYAGKELLTVDKKMIHDGQMFFSRDADELVNKVLKSSKQEPDLQRTRKIQEEVKGKLFQVLDEFGIA